MWLYCLGALYLKPFNSRGRTTLTVQQAGVCLYINFFKRGFVNNKHYLDYRVEFYAKIH